MLKGIDLSYANTVTDWQKVKNNVDFVMLRAGYGKNNIDENLVKYAKACNELGIHLGLYWFSYAYTVEMARNEAKYCIAQAKKYNIDYPIAFDFEYDSVRYAQTKGANITKELVMAMTEAFCEEIKAAGYMPVVYTNKDYLNRYFDEERLKELGYNIWYAYYNKEIDRKENIALWQYTSSGSVDGIIGNVDMNYALEDVMGKSYGWIQDESGLWWYKNPDGSYTKNDWQQIDGKWYHFDDKGWMQTGWLELGGRWYYLKEDGSMAENEFLYIKSEVHGVEMFAFDINGHMLRTDNRGALY